MGRVSHSAWWIGCQVGYALTPHTHTVTHVVVNRLIHAPILIDIWLGWTQQAPHPCVRTHHAYEGKLTLWQSSKSHYRAYRGCVSLCLKCSLLDWINSNFKIQFEILCEVQWHTVTSKAVSRKTWQSITRINDDDDQMVWILCFGLLRKNMFDWSRQIEVCLLPPPSAFIMFVSRENGKHKRPL